mmetsp:Transcript_31769/g.62433  ORF Transcript_31769/g.62433 Transcript_31769/m.62433 type:complete len:91 (-) Transcript_31769:887-1159(-)
MAAMSENVAITQSSTAQSTNWSQRDFLLGFLYHRHGKCGSGLFLDGHWKMIRCKFRNLYAVAPPCWRLQRHMLFHNVYSRSIDLCEFHRF